MGCTIGWIKTENGYILFKNRDTLKEFMHTNRFKENDKIVGIGYNTRKGMWIGINKHNIGFTSSKGPHRKRDEIPSWIEFNVIGEYVLKRSESLDEAVSLFIKEYKHKKVGESANILLCDNKKAVVLELCQGKVKVREYYNDIFVTNHFRYLKKYNSFLNSLETSKLRLKKIKKLFRNKKVRESVDLFPLLKYHSRDTRRNICRHGKVVTVASAVFEVILPHTLIANTILNEHPCKRKYSTHYLNW